MTSGSSDRPMTPLAEALAARIRRNGPISVADYMEACLNNSEHGYYRKQEAIGRTGDFITAPEISQIFGELIGLWCAVVWQRMGKPRQLNLIELGPGRGTLMRDALRAARTLAAFRNALTAHLVESNPTLEALQRAALEDEDIPLHWSADVGSVAGRAPTIVIANEFLDTLPVAQWVYRGGLWCERHVALDRVGHLVFEDAEPAAQPRVPPELGKAARDGDVLETRTKPLELWSGKLAALGPPLASLFIDYGHVRPALGETLQAIRSHRYDDPLKAPGEADLTAQVDFTAVADEMSRRGLACDGPVTQAEFLGALGVVERASHLMAANPARAAEIETGVARLLAPGGMGTRFHAIGIRDKGLAALPGFDAVDIGPPAP